MSSEGAKTGGGELNEEALAAKVAESFSEQTKPAPERVSSRPKPEELKATEVQQLKAVQQKIEQLPETAAKVAQAVTAPAVSVAEHARSLLQQQFGSDNEMRIYQALARTGAENGPNELAAQLVKARELHIDAHNDLEEKPLS